MKTHLVIIALLALTVSAIAETGVSLTVYNQNLALVRDTRKMDFKKGNGEIRFRDVSAQIDATSVHFKAGGVNMLEQNFDYDLVSPDKLLQKYVDNKIEVVAKDGAVSKGILLTSGDTSTGQIVLQQEDGTIKSVVLPNNVTEIRYPNLPQGLITKPTLRWLVNSDAEGSKETEVSYLTGGLNWHAEYVMLLNEANTQTDLDAWVTLENTCGASYENAKLKLIAGEVHRAAQGGRMQKDYMRAPQAAMMADAQFAEQSFFEYHLYTLQRPTSVLNNQTKQVSLFPSTTALVKKIYTYDWQQNDKKVSVSAEFENKQENGLGMALPAGKIRVYQKSSDGSPEFIGEDNIDHTPKNEKVTVKIGDVFDVAAERSQMDTRRISDRVNEADYSIKLRNHKKETVEIVVLDHPYGDWEVTKSSLTYKKISATKLEFRVSVEPEQEATLTYTIRTR
jgi:hypothetical protein